MIDGDVVRMFVIYDNPTDYPGFFVLRGFSIVSGNPDPVPDDHVLKWPSIRGPRAWCRLRGLVRLERNPGDEPQIVEVWL
jgi:hypothetical protein